MGPTAGVLWRSGILLPMAAADYAAARLVEERTVPTVRNGEFLEVKKRIDAGGVWVVSVRRR